MNIHGLSLFNLSLQHFYADLLGLLIEAYFYSNKGIEICDDWEMFELTISNVRMGAKQM
jgi:hypothetical protein